MASANYLVTCTTTTISEHSQPWNHPWVCEPSLNHGTNMANPRFVHNIMYTIELVGVKVFLHLPIFQNWHQHRWTLAKLEFSSADSLKKRLYRKKNSKLDKMSNHLVPVGLLNNRARCTFRPMNRSPQFVSPVSSCTDSRTISTEPFWWSTIRKLSSYRQLVPSCWPYPLHCTCFVCKSRISSWRRLWEIVGRLRTGWRASSSFSDMQWHEKGYLVTGENV